MSPIYLVCVCGGGGGMQLSFACLQVIKLFSCSDKSRIITVTLKCYLDESISIYRSWLSKLNLLEHEKCSIASRADLVIKVNNTH